MLKLALVCLLLLIMMLSLCVISPYLSGRLIALCTGVRLTMPSIVLACLILMLALLPVWKLLSILWTRLTFLTILLSEVSCMVFPTQYDPRDRIFAAPGDRMKTLYAAQVTHEGTIELEESGKENFYDYIQSFAESCDINTIIKRFAAGETDVLTKKQGVFDDLTKYPKTYAELLNTVIAGEQAFMELPLETRAKFNHDYRQWLAAMDDMPAWMDAMGIVSDPVENNSAEPDPEPQPDPEPSV